MIKKTGMIKKTDLCLLACLFFAVFSVTLAWPADAQTTVGNATTFVLEEGKSASYGINGGDIGQTQFGQELFTRHQKIGNTTGIGSSSLQTTTVTSEGARSFLTPFSVTGTQPSAFTTNMGTATQGYSGNSPALGGLTVNPANGLTVSPANGLNFGSGLSPSYAGFSGSSSSSLAPASVYQDLNAIPSFSRAGSRLSLPDIRVESESDFLLKKGGPQY